MWSRSLGKTGNVRGHLGSGDRTMKLPTGVNILLGFAPYIAFFLVMRAVAVDVGLWAALLIAVFNAGRDWALTGSLKLLEVGTVLLFAALAIFTAAARWD